MHFDVSSGTSSTSELEVPRTDAAGNVLSRDSYAEMKERVLNKAKMQWNDLNTSDAPRFQVSTSTGVVAFCGTDGGL